MNQNDSQKARQDQKYQIRFLTYSFFKKKKMLQEQVLPENTEKEAFSQI